MGVRALVVFSGQTDFWWRRVLKPGYRHCGVIVECGQHWLVVEPLAPHLHLRLLPMSGDALTAALKRRGLDVVETLVRLPGGPGRWPSLFSCVEVVKRTLGLREPMVQTPWQLWQKILENRKINL